MEVKSNVSRTNENFPHPLMERKEKLSFFFIFFF